MLSFAMSQNHGLVLAQTPERQEARTLAARIDALATAVTELGSEIDALRAALSRFESSYHQHLARQNEQILRAENVLRRLVRWERLVSAVATESDDAADQAWGRGVARVRAQHQRDSDGRSKSKARLVQAAALPIANPGQLKELWRVLARRFHPDLVHDETARLRHSRMMAHINGLYKDGDLGRLAALHNNSTDMDADGSDSNLVLMRERCARLEEALQKLQAQRAALVASPTYTLWQHVALGEREGVDIFDNMQAQLQARADQCLVDVVEAIRQLEVAVTRSAQPDTQLTAVGDAFEMPRLVALGLQAVASQVDAPTLQLSQVIQEMARQEPAVLRLMLLTYVCEQSPTPLVGLEKFEDMQLRFESLPAIAGARMPALEKALCDADAYVEYAVRRNERGALQTSLRFVRQGLDAAVGHALQTFAVRQAFCDVLTVLGEYASCGPCGRDVFFVPLYRTRGLDDLRASVCPRCGHTKRSYWLPCGNDVQAVLNDVFIAYEIIYAYDFVLPNMKVSMQLVPVQVETLTVSDLIQRFATNVFARYDVAITAHDIMLRQDDTFLSPDTPLVDLDSSTFMVHLRPPAAVNWDDAVEQVQQRVRTRFHH